MKKLLTTEQADYIGRQLSHGNYLKRLARRQDGFSRYRGKPLYECVLCSFRHSNPLRMTLHLRSRHPHG